MRHGRALLGIAVLAISLLGPAAVSVTGPAARADPSPTPSPKAGTNNEAPLRLNVTRLTPRAPQPGGTLRVTGRITNTGSTPARRIRVWLRIGDRVTTRSALHDADIERPQTSRRAGTLTVPVLADLEPGQSTTFDLRTTVNRLRMDRPGVYPLDIEALGSFDGSYGRLGLAPTWLPWFAGEPIQQNKMAVVIPLVDLPRRSPDDVQLDDTLATSLSPSGRLGRLLSAGRIAETGECDVTVPAVTVVPSPGTTPAPRCEPVPITWAVDPDLLYTAKAMTSSYVVKNGGKTTHGTGERAAATWLTSLRGALSQSGLLALPFADPDVSALTRDSQGKSDVAQAVALGQSVAKDVLGQVPLTAVAFPPAGPVTPAATDALTGEGTRALVLDPSAFAAKAQDTARTPDARTPLPTSASGGPLDGLVVDTGMSKLLAGVQDPSLSSRLAEQRFLVETAVVAAELPSVSRTFVLAIDRRGRVNPTATGAALRDLGRVPWLCPVPLGDVATGTEHCDGQAPEKVPRTSPRGDPRSDSNGQIAPTYLARVEADRDAGAQLVDAVLKPSDTASKTRSRLRRAVARAESSAWRNDATGARQSAALLHSTVAGLRGRVTVHGGRLLLTSTKGTLNVTVQNTLTAAVECRVTFFSPTAKLSTAQTGLIDIGPGRAVQASVRAAARTSGQFVVFAQMVDRDGKPFGERAEVIVRSTRYGRVALTVTGLAAAVLMIAAGVRIIRRARRRRRPDPSRPS